MASGTCAIAGEERLVEGDQLVCEALGLSEVAVPRQHVGDRRLDMGPQLVVGGRSARRPGCGG